MAAIESNWRPCGKHSRVLPDRIAIDLELIFDNAILTNAVSSTSKAQLKRNLICLHNSYL